MERLSLVGKETLDDIAYSLDRLKGTIEYWRLLIPLLPKESYRYNKIDVEEFALVGTKGGSPSLQLLQEFQRKGMDLSHFKNMLQTIECQGALDCFKLPTRPVILEHPKSKTIFVNEKLELRCAAKCIPEPPDYQWFYYGTTSILLKGAKSWKLTINKVMMRHTGYYCCRVHNRRQLRDDGYAEFSQYAMVTVKNDRRAELETSGGSTHSFAPVQEVSDQSHETLQPPVSIPPSCDEVTDGMRNIQITSPIESTDTVGPDQSIKIITHPKSQTIRLERAEEIVMLECRAESPSGYHLKYKWYYLRGGENPATLKKENKSVKSTDPYYNITVKLSKKQQFRYFCDVSIANQPECCVSSDIAVIKLECVWFVEQPQENYVTVTGKDLKVSCRVETTPNITVKYQWFKCQQNGIGKQPIGYHDNEMMLPGIISSRGYYVCDVMPSISDTINSNVTHVEVVNPVNITVEVQPPTDRYVELNETLVIKFKAVCKQHPMKYQWYHNGAELPGCTNPTLTIESIADHHMGSYYCEASSDYSAAPVISETCRVHWKETNSNLSTINRQQFDAEEVMIIKDRIWATDKMALLIGNCGYKGKPLKCSKNDVKAVADKLRQLNFKTISLVDLTLSQMAKAIDYFCTLLDHGMYAVFYYSGHGLENQVTKTTYLMPIDADEPAKFDQCMNIDDIAPKMQAKQSKVVMIFDCCRINPPSSDAVSIPLSSVPSGVDQSRGFSNLCQLFACASSFETYENRDGHYSYMTEAFLQEVDKPDTMLQVLSSVQNYHADLKLVPAGGRISPTVEFVVKMKALNKISFHDPILNEQELKDKELLLALPENCCLEFTNPKLKNMYGQVELRFSAKFSNVLIVHVVCDPALQPEVIGAELEGGTKNEDDKTITPFKIANLLDVVQDENSKLQISFQMPQDSSAKETLEYKIPTETINPTFYHH